MDFHLKYIYVHINTYIDVSIFTRKQSSPDSSIHHLCDSFSMKVLNTNAFFVQINHDCVYL